MNGGACASDFTTFPPCIQHKAHHINRTRIIIIIIFLHFYFALACMVRAQNIFYLFSNANVNKRHGGNANARRDIFNAEICTRGEKPLSASRNRNDLYFFSFRGCCAVFSRSLFLLRSHSAWYILNIPESTSLRRLISIDFHERKERECSVTRIEVHHLFSP